MDRTVSRLNIEYLRKKLAEETNSAKRETLRRLLTEEEGRLAGTKGAASQPERRP
jgi:hypothetical protein